MQQLAYLHFPFRCRISGVDHIDALKPWWCVINASKQIIQFVWTCTLAAGVSSIYKWDGLFPFLTEKEQVFFISRDRCYKNTNISPWLVIALLLPQMLLVLWAHGVFTAFNSWPPFLLAVVFEDLLRRVFFLLYEWNLLAEHLSVGGFNMSCGACRGVMLRVLAAVVSCSWRCFLVNSGWGGGGWGRLCSVWGQLCLGSLLFIIITMKAKAFFCVCTHGYYCTTLPNLSLAPLWPALNCCLPIFSSSPPTTHCWVFFHLALCISPLPSLVPPRGSLALQECLHSSSPLINSLLSQSHLILFAHFPFLLHLLPFLPNLTSI